MEFFCNASGCAAHGYKQLILAQREELDLSGHPSNILTAAVPLVSSLWDNNFVGKQFLSNKVGYFTESVIREITRQAL